jgi:hypothetical protein
MRLCARVRARVRVRVRVRARMWLILCWLAGRLASLQCMCRLRRFRETAG